MVKNNIRKSLLEQGLTLSEKFILSSNNQIQETIDMFNPVNIRSENDFDPIVKKYALEIIISFPLGLYSL